MKQTAKGPVLIVGARSDIGQALARAYAAEGADLILAARQAPLLDPLRVILSSATESGSS